MATQTVTSTTSNPLLQQYLPFGMSEARRLYGLGGPQYFPGSTVVPWSTQTQDAMDLTENRARQGSPMLQAGQNELQSTLQGDYLFGGQGFDRAMDAAQRDILPRVDSSFEKSGRYGSGLHREAQTRAMGDAFAKQYGAERTNQMRGMMFAPQMAQADYADIGQLANVGGAYEAQQGSNLQDQISRWNYNQNLPQANLSDYMASMQGGSNAGSTSTTSQPIYQNTAGNALGGALAGWGLGSKLGSSGVFGAASPYLGAAGAGLGLLSGFF